MFNYKPFTKAASLYDAIYTKKQYAYEARVVDKLIQSYNIRGKTLLDIGCGTGKHCVEFARLGYTPTGIDCSLPMLAVAKQNMKKTHSFFDLVHADIINYKSRKKFAVAVSLFHVLSYQVTNASVIKFFQTVRRCIKPSGLFIFDCWYGPGVFLHTPTNRTQQFRFQNATITRGKKNTWDIEHNVVHVHHTIYIHGLKKPPTHELHSMRYFFLPELRCFLSLAGFQLLEWGRLAVPLAPMRRPSWNICLLARRT